jgi:hypothetical protein
MTTHTIKFINDIEEDQYRSDLQLCKLAFSNYFDKLEEQRIDETTKKYLKNSALFGAGLLLLAILFFI